MHTLTTTPVNNTVVLVVLVDAYQIVWSCTDQSPRVTIKVSGIL